MIEKFVSAALEAFDMRSHRAESLYDLATHFRIAGKNELAFLFAKRGYEIPFPEQDILFVEEFPYKWGFKQELSISGWYCKDPSARQLGWDCCEELATSHAAPAEVRDEAWNNLFCYTRPLSESCPSFVRMQIDFTPPPGFRPMNPSIVRMGDKMFLNIRTVDYLIGDDGRYRFANDREEASTRNFICSVSDGFEIALLSELALPADFLCVYRGVLGIEDVRLFPIGDDLWLSASSRQHSPEGKIEIVTARIGSGGRLCEWQAIPSPTGNRVEKNWMPIVGSHSWIYSVDPTHRILPSGEPVTFTVPGPLLSRCGGSTQAIPFDDGFLAMVHERQASLDPMHGQRNYQQRFVWLDASMQIRNISRRFILGSGAGEFPCGMCIHPDGQQLVITYGILDREAWLATVDLYQVRAFLGLSGAAEYRPHPALLDLLANATAVERMRDVDAPDRDGLSIPWHGRAAIKAEHPNLASTLEAMDMPTLPKDVPMITHRDRIKHYREHIYDHVQGWVEPNTWRVIEAIGDIFEADKIFGNVAEFGVHHGRFLFLIDALCNGGEQSIAVGIWDDPDLKYIPEPHIPYWSFAQQGSLATFKDNWGIYSPNRRIDIVQTDTFSLDQPRLPRPIKFLSIDAGHAHENVVNDLCLAQDVLAQGGIVALDDFLRPDWMGVTEGALSFLSHHNRRLRPMLFFENKLYLTTISEHKRHLERIASAMDGVFDLREMIGYPFLSPR